jgi:hypothetical protein
MNLDWCLNLLGLIIATLGAVLMYWYPPIISQYTPDGRSIIPFAAEATEASKRLAKWQNIYSKSGPVLLALGFLSQLSALILVGVLSNATVNLTTSEMFNIRSKCAQMGQELAEKEAEGAVLIDQITQYDAKKNQCLVKLHSLSQVDSSIFINLYDAQTHERLAGTIEKRNGKQGWISNMKTHESSKTSYEAAIDFIQKAMSEQ